jgi:predicted component of viral defense system (DUF524 family)
MAIQTSGASGWLTIDNRPLSFEAEDENKVLNITEYHYPPYTIKITRSAPEQLELSIDGQILETARYGIWTWNPKHYAGLYRIIAAVPDQQPQSALVRVFPHKFTQARYERMKDDLSRIAIDLQLRLDSPAMERAEYAAQTQETSALQEYRKIRKIIEQMKDVMVHMRREPYHALREEQRQQDWQEIQNFSSEAVPIPGDYIHLSEVQMSKYGIRSLPQYWMQPQSIPTYDTYENRLLKHFLRQQLLPKLDIIQEHAENDKRRLEVIYARYQNVEDDETINRLKRVLDECEDMKQRCIRWSNEPFLKMLPPPAFAGKATQVLLKHPTYSRFYQLYLQFQQNLKMTYETEKYVNELALRRVSELYEMWSVFSMMHIAIEELLAAGYRITSSSIFYQVKKDCFQFDVQKNVASIVLEREDVRVEIKYEPIYPNQSTVRYRSALVATTMGTYPLTPDMAIEVYKGDEPQNVLIFDAKYRWEREHYTPKQEDIDRMYRYRSNIQYKRYDAGNRRQPYTTEAIVSSASILYPGNKIQREANSRVGGMPFIPGTSQRVGDVREQVKDLLYYAYLID